MKTTHTMYPRQTGLTLIEILVAMVISLILMAGVLQIFQSNKQSFRVQESLSLIQENGRTAIRILTDDLRIADSWGCRVEDNKVTDNLDPNGAGFVDLRANGGLAGTDGGAAANPDTITITGTRSTGITLSGPMASDNANIPVVSSADLQPNDIVYITDCQGGDIFQVTNAILPATNIQHTTGGGTSFPDNNTNTLNRVYDSTAMLFQARQATYSIQPINNEPHLVRTVGGVPSGLVEGIENMQIEYGELLNIVNGTMRYVNAGVGSLDMSQVQSVRITLTVRSVATNVAIGGGDGRLRRTFSTTVSIRNRNP